MKTLLLSIAIGNDFEQISKITTPTMQKYATKIGSDLQLITEQKISPNPLWEKFIIKDLLKSYDRIIYLDNDIIIRDDCPDLLDMISPDRLGILPKMPADESEINSLSQTYSKYGNQNWNGAYYHTGVMIISRQHRNLFEKPDEEFGSAQNFINLKINQLEIQCQPIHYKFNRMSYIDALTGEERLDSYILHYSGLLQTHGVNFVVNLIEKDLKTWGKSDYNFKKHIVLDIKSNIGDHMNAEPVIRYALNNIWKDQDVRIRADYPRIFEHLPVPVSDRKETMEYDVDIISPYITGNLPSPQTGLGQYVSNFLSHTTDTYAISMLKRTLPDKDKTPQLKVNQKDIDEIKTIIDDPTKLILIHAGKDWASRTFPIEWWQKIADGIQEQGIQVCLIGKTNPYNVHRSSVLPLETKNMIDTRDLLSLGGLIALISQAKVLISNDSGPIHIAGAFDNYIILIPSCKHPDHVLPYRNSDKYYKSFALYKKLTVDSIDTSPNSIYSFEEPFFAAPLFNMDGKDYYDFLPEPEEVIECTKNIWNTNQHLQP